LALAFIFSVMALPRSIGATGDELQPEDYEYTEVTVNQGDTLWSIAVNSCPDSLDTSRAVVLIKEVNNLSNCVIQPGQRLFVPSENLTD